MESQLKQKELYKESILNQVKEIRASSDGVGCPYCGQPVKKKLGMVPVLRAFACGLVHVLRGGHSSRRG